MPIYEFKCQACAHTFEELILPWKENAERTPVCPSCQAKDVEKVLSVFAVKTDATRQSNLNTARKAARKIKQEKDTEDQKQIMEHAAEHH